MNNAFNTDYLFASGKLTFLLDASAGSSGKGKVASFITEHSDKWQFCCNTFGPQAGHTVILNDGKRYFYQTLNSCAYQDKYEKMYIGPGATIELPSLWREMEENNVKPHKLGISPVTSILQDIDKSFERGETDFNGNLVVKHLGTMKSGSTCHGVGACKARKILRSPNVKLARDIPELKEFLCDVPGEIMDRLDNGQSGFCEIAQGFQLSYLLPEFYPHCTSRNCTVMAALDDLMIPPIYVGNLLLNVRTFPIRINNKKYIAEEDGRHLTWQEIQSGVPHKVEVFNSGHGYDDQREITWEELTAFSGSPEPIIEMTSVTKLPRRVFTFSKKNLYQAIRYNNCGRSVYLFVNYINYIDHIVAGESGSSDIITDKIEKWLNENIKPVCDQFNNVELKYLGTGPKVDDVIDIN